MKEYCEHYDFDCKKEEMTCEGCGYYKKSADEMFSELGYEITEIKDDNTKADGIQFTRKDRYLTKVVEFYFYHKTILIKTIQDVNGKEIEWTCEHLDIKELQAINKKVEELRMEIIIRILVALGIVFLTGLVIGILWGIYIQDKQNKRKGE